jgi:outer membrane protein
MNKILFSAALAASLGASSAANSQAIPGAIIAVVDLEKVTSECTACKAAAANLRSQVSGLQTREQALSTPLETEQKSIQTAVDALAGKQPDAALQARAKAWETKRQQAAQEIGRQQDQIKRNQAYISQQIQTKLGPIYQQVMQKRGANLMVEVGNTLASGANLDVTGDVLASLNAALPTVQMTAPAAAAQQQPQGR